jgi:hypothetical protein
MNGGRRRELHASNAGNVARWEWRLWLIYPCYSLGVTFELVPTPILGSAGSLPSATRAAGRDLDPARLAPPRRETRRALTPERLQQPEHPHAERALLRAVASTAKL